MAKVRTNTSSKKPQPKVALQPKVTAKDEERVYRSFYAILSSFWWRLEPIYRAKFRQAAGPVMKRMNDPIRVQITHDMADPLVKRFVVDIIGMFDKAARQARISLGQRDAASWDIRNVSIYDQIKQHEIKLAESTISDIQAATADEAQRLIEQMQVELLAGQKAGETLADKTDRLAKFFAESARWKARRIAVTESNRAHNAGFLAGTEDMEVVVGYEWLLSDDACEECKRIGLVNGRPRRVKKGQPFATGQSKEAYYATIQTPPLHPNCRCTLVGVLDVEAPDKWDETVDESSSGSPATGTPDPQKIEVLKPEEPTKPTQISLESLRNSVLEAEEKHIKDTGSRHVDVSGSVDDVMKRYTVGDAKISAIKKYAETMLPEDYNETMDLPNKAGVYDAQNFVSIQYEGQTAKVADVVIDIYFKQKAVLDKVRDDVFAILQVKPENKQSLIDPVWAKGTKPTKELSSISNDIIGKLEKCIGKPQADDMGCVIGFRTNKRMSANGQCKPGGPIEIRLERTSTISHEIGHALAISNANVSKNIRLNARMEPAFTRKIIPIMKKVPESSMKAVRNCNIGCGRSVKSENEFYFKDYSSKQYGATSSNGFTEVPSILMDYFYHNPVEFVKNMPVELTKTVLGLLDGALK